MPVYYIRTCNADFESLDDGRTFGSAGDALAAGVESAAKIAAEEIANGRPAAAVDVVVENKAGDELMRSVVTIAVAPLAVRDGAEATKAADPAND